MKIWARKIRTDNGPLDSHVDYYVVGRPDIGVDVFWFGEKGGELFQRYAPFKRCKFTCEETLGEPLFNKLGRPYGSAFPYGGVNVPGTGHVSGPAMEIEIQLEMEI